MTFVFFDHPAPTEIYTLSLHDALPIYEEAATYCHGVKDYVSRDLFESLMKDEEHHIDFLETQLHLIERIGLDLYTQRSEEHTSELQSRVDLVCRLLLEKKKR